jgi:amino acid transporter
MEINNIQQLAKNLNHPGGATQSPEEEVTNLLHFLHELDGKEKKKLRRLSFLFSLGALFFLVFLFIPTEPDFYILTQTGRVLLFIAYLAIALIAFFGKRTLEKTDYSLSVLELLKKTEKRYLFFNFRLWYVYPLMLILDASCSLILLGNCYVPCNWSLAARIGLTQLVFLFILAVGFYFGYKDWKKNKRGQYEKIRRIIHDLTVE